MRTFREVLTQNFIESQFYWHLKLKRVFLFDAWGFLSFFLHDLRQKCQSVFKIFDMCCCYRHGLKLSSKKNWLHFESYLMKLSVGWFRSGNWCWLSQYCSSFNARRLFSEFISPVEFEILNNWWMFLNFSSSRIWIGTDQKSLKKTLVWETPHDIHISQSIS